MAKPWRSQDGAFDGGHTVAVRLSEDTVRVGGVGGEAGVVVAEARHLLLLEQRHLRRQHAEVSIGLEQLLRARQRVLGHHNGERQLHRLAGGLGGAALQREDRADVKLQVALVGGDLVGKRHLDPREAQPLAQPSGDQHERAAVELLHADLLVLEIVGACEAERGAGGHARRPALERVDARLGVGKQLPCVGHIGLEPARIGRVQLSHLLEEARLVTALRPLCEEVSLSELLQCGPHHCSVVRAVDHHWAREPGSAGEQGADVTPQH